MTPCTSVPVSNFDQNLVLTQGESSSLGGFSAIMDIIWDVDSGFILRTFPDHKVNYMSNETCPTNNNLFIVGSIDFNARSFYIRTVTFLQNHVGHEYDTNSVLFPPMENTLALDQMTQPLCCLI